MSEVMVKAMNDLYSNVSFGGGGGGGGSTKPTKHQSCQVIAATVGTTISIAGDIASKAPHPAAKVAGNAAKIAGPAIGAGAYYACMKGRVGPTDTSGESKYFGI